MSLMLSELIRPNILAMQAYSSARSLTEQAGILLDANEAPDELQVEDVLNLNRYPSPQPPELRRSLADFYQVQPDQICMGRGADEAIDLLVRATCEPGRDAILTCPPTYGMYAVAADIQGARHITVSMRLDGDRFTLDRAGVSRALNSGRVKLFFLCRPNNPTGELLPLDAIQEITEIAVATASLVVVDEAYIEFADDQSATALIGSCPNVVVLRTFSKAWAMAGARFGVMIGSPELINVLGKVRAPYPISTPVRSLVSEQLSSAGVARMQERVSRIKTAREQLRDELRSLEAVSVIYPSAANYLLVKVPGKAHDVFQHLLQQGIVVRDRSSQPLLSDCLRISVGSAADHRALLNALKTWEESRHA